MHPPACFDIIGMHPPAYRHPPAFRHPPACYYRHPPIVGIRPLVFKTSVIAGCITRGLSQLDAYLRMSRAASAADAYDICIRYDRPLKADAYDEFYFTTAERKLWKIADGFCSEFPHD
jgi:hypothetical protein